MTKLKQHKLLVILALVLVIALVVLAFMVRFFKSTRPLFPDMTDLQVSSISWSEGYGDPPRHVELEPGVDFDVEKLAPILADCRISPSFFASKAGIVSLGGDYFTFNAQSGPKGQREGSLLTIGQSGDLVAVARSRFAWEIENHDEIYSRLMDFFGDKLPT